MPDLFLEALSDFRGVVGPTMAGEDYVPGEDAVSARSALEQIYILVQNIWGIQSPGLLEGGICPDSSKILE